MTPKVSVIIPVYNAEKFINDTLDCVLGQTMREIEVICVDDGSRDNSLELLRARALTDDRLMVISQPNSGAGVARNNGLVHAKGEYISWLDSDDLFEKDMLQVAYDACKKQNADIGDVRDIFNSAYAIYQQGGGENGDSGIFGTADGDGTHKLGAADDFVSCQG